MRRSSASPLFVISFALLLLSGVPDAQARAQTLAGALRCFVVDSAGDVVADAEIRLPRLGRIGRTDSVGRVGFDALALGRFDVSVRRLGYLPQTRHVFVGGGGVDSFTFVLTRRVLELDEMTVSAIGEHPFFAGFDERRRLGVGTFISRDVIDATHSSTTSDVFRQLPQVQLVATASGMGVRFPTAMTSISKISTLTRGISAALCAPTIFLDGQAAPSLEVDDILSSDIQAIEIYRGMATTPAQFAVGGMLQCGAIAVWTRRKK